MSRKRHIPTFSDTGVSFCGRKISSGTGWAHATCVSCRKRFLTVRGPWDPAIVDLALRYSGRLGHRYVVLAPRPWRGIAGLPRAAEIVAECSTYKSAGDIAANTPESRIYERKDGSWKRVW